MNEAFAKDFSNKSEVSLGPQGPIFSVIRQNCTMAQFMLNWNSGRVYAKLGGQIGIRAEFMLNWAGKVIQFQNHGWGKVLHF